MAIWVREDKVGKTFTLPSPKDKEHLMQDQIWIQVPTSKLSFAAVYVPPGEQYVREEQLHLLLDFISISQKLGLRPIILGDLNVHDVHVVDVNIQNPQMRLEHIFLTYMLAFCEMKCATVGEGGNTATRIPEGGRRFQQPSTLDYIVVEENLEIGPLVIDADRIISMPSDHVMIYVEVIVNNQVGTGPIPEIEQPMGAIWDRIGMRNEDRMHDFAQAIAEKVEDQVQFDDIQLEYDRLHELIHNTAKSFFLNENPRRREIRLPRRYYELRSTLRKARKILRENQ